MYQNQHWCDNFTVFDKFQLLQTLGADVCLILSLEYEKKMFSAIFFRAEIAPSFPIFSAADVSFYATI